MTLRHMKIFRAVCDNDFNTTKAAEELHMTQPAISQAIKDMEEYYKVSMFDRVGRRLVITQAGKRVEEYSRHIDNLFNDMENELLNWDKCGEIRIGATLTIGSMFMPMYVKTFKEKYPDIKVKVLCGNADVLERKIIANELDIALSEGIASHPSIVSREYMDDQLTVFCKAGEKYTQGQTISVEEFKSQDIILREPGSGTRKVFEMAAEKIGFSVEPVWESISISGIIGAVASGLGLGILPHRLLYTAQKYNKIVTINVEGLDLNRKFYIIHHKEKTFSPAIENFLASCTEVNESLVNSVRKNQQ